MKKVLKRIYRAVNRRFAKRENLLANPNQGKFHNVEIMSSVILSGENEIGEYTYIGFNSIITKSKIGRYCSIAGNVSIGIGEHKINRVSTSSIFYKNAWKTLTEKECVIGNDVWIGTNSVIRRGVTIGDGAVIGANSFVNKDVKPFEVVAGAPAKFIKMRFTDLIIESIRESDWWSKDLNEARTIIEKLELTRLFEQDDK
ncbi:CatB-related O-acetyltransferase [Flavobacterium chilense]|uniref:Transferase hexapeptide (Six repeat-containing protein) n=1 Tax=Flavobacterium chilense TaxID=946677 RepID=A0A1M7GS14_9FLAO|nr:CatB-related O-acetyltransferase [Flavobacterium chilense]SHM18707.1 transferase hexapeptide (six repeat-containing protein) [Flavobacterium chilense]